MIPKSHHNTEFDSEILSQLLFRKDQLEVLLQVIEINFQDFT